MIQSIKAFSISIMTVFPKMVRPSAIIVHAGEQDRLQTILRRAILNSKPEVAKNAIDSGAPINRQDLGDVEFKDYHLVRASYFGETKIGEMLIRAGAEVNVSCEHGHTPAMVVSERNNPTLLQSLLRAGADVNRVDVDGLTALMGAAKRADLTSIKMLLRSGAKLDAVDNEGKSALMAVINCWNRAFRPPSPMSYKQSVRKLISASTINLADYKGTTPLMLAASKGLPDIVSLLLDAGADKSMTNHLGQTAFTVAKEQKQAKDELIQRQREIIALLKDIPVKSVKSELSNSRSTKEPSRLSTAIFWNEIEKVRTYIEAGDDLHEIGIMGPLLTQAAIKGKIEIVKLLFAAGVDVHQEYRGETAIDATLWWMQHKQEEADEYTKIMDILV